MENTLAYLNQSHYQERIEFFKKNSIDACQTLLQEQPQLLSLMISDLITIRHYDDVGISYGSGIVLARIRSMKDGRLKVLTAAEQSQLSRFYLSVFVKFEHNVVHHESAY